ncbi:MAG: tyrosine-type recombinase/integrase [Candidatus Zixiibacteriota bacterium]
MNFLKALYEFADTRSVGNWATYINQFIFTCRVKNLSPVTLNGYGERLFYLARYLEGRGVDIEDITPANLKEYILGLIGAVSTSTVNGRIRVYRRFFKVLCEEGVWTKPNPAASLKLIKEERKIKDALDPIHIERLLNSIPKHGFENYRNYTLILTAFDCMARRKELANLKVEDVDLRDGLRTLKHTKGSKWRIIPVGPKTLKVLHFYVNRYRKQLPGEYLFCKTTGEKISDQHLYQIVSRVAQRVGIRAGVHLLRHSRATQFIRGGGNVYILSKNLGHQNVATTEIYLHLNRKDMIDQHMKFSPANSVKL